MIDAAQLTRIEQSIEIEATADRVFDILTDPNNITRYAAGIEGAEVLKAPNGDHDYTGAKIQLVTKSGNILLAEVITADRPRLIVVRDERGVTASWSISDVTPGKVRIDNVIEGPIPSNRALKVRYDADVKFQALQYILEAEDNHNDVLPSAVKARPARGPVD